MANSAVSNKTFNANAADNFMFTFGTAPDVIISWSMFKD